MKKNIIDKKNPRETLDKKIFLKTILSFMFILLIWKKKWVTTKINIKYNNIFEKLEKFNDRNKKNTAVVYM